MNASHLKTCFVIAPIGSDGSATRRRSDQVLKHIIAPAVEPAGYQVIRADNIAKPGLITHQIIEHLINADLVVADLTERNPNVFYELAIRHVIRKPFIQLIRVGEEIPFDIGGLRTISFDHQDLDSVDETRHRIAAQIVEIESGKDEIATPISLTIDVKSLKASSDPEGKGIASILEVLSDLRSELQTVARRGAFPTNVLGEADLQRLPPAASRARVESRLRAISCPVHAQSPRVAWADRVALVGACCGAALDLTAEILADVAAAEEEGK